MKKTIERSEFGARLFDARTQAGLKQEAAAREIGISQGTLAELEKKGSSSGHVPRFAALYGVSPLWLATGEGDRHAGVSQSSTRLTIGVAATAIAKGARSLDERTRRRIAQDVAFMIENGPRESEASAIDALATVDVLLPLAPRPHDEHDTPERVKLVDIDHELEESLRGLIGRYTTLNPTQRSAMVAALQGIKEQSWDLTDETSSRYLARGRELSFERRPTKPKARGGRQ